MNKPTAMDWIRVKLLEHDWDWVAENWQLHRSECRRAISHHSFARQMRMARDEFNTAIRAVPATDHDGPREGPLRASDVGTVEQLADYGQLDPLKYEITGGEMTTWGNPDNENKRVKIRFRERPGIDETLDEMWQRFIADAREHAPVYQELMAPQYASGNIQEIYIPDLHIGRLTNDYDLDVAAAAYRQAVGTLLARGAVYQPERILFVTGSDLVNANGASGRTANGTPQQTDPRYRMVFTRTRQLLVRIIDMLRDTAPVDVVMIRGNHDDQIAYYLGEVLSAWYSRCDDVRVDNTERYYKYYHYGVNLIGLAHGDRIKPDELAMLMPNEVPQLWAQTQVHEWHIGHLHHRRSKSFQQAVDKMGVRVEHIPTLALPDDYTHQSGYWSLREGQSFIWSAHKGKLATLFFQPDVRPGDGRSDSIQGPDQERGLSSPTEPTAGL